MNEKMETDINNNVRILSVVNGYWKMAKLVFDKSNTQLESIRSEITKEELKEAINNLIDKYYCEYDFRKNHAKELIDEGLKVMHKEIGDKKVTFTEVRVYHTVNDYYNIDIFYEYEFTGGDSLKTVVKGISKDNAIFFGKELAKAYDIELEID